LENNTIIYDVESIKAKAKGLVRHQFFNVSTYLYIQRDGRNTYSLLALTSESNRPYVTIDRTSIENICDELTREKEL
jgi:hypothetical protein